MGTLNIRRLAVSLVVLWLLGAAIAQPTVKTAKDAYDGFFWGRRLHALDVKQDAWFRNCESGYAQQSDRKICYNKEPLDEEVASLRYNADDNLYGLSVVLEKSAGWFIIEFGGAIIVAVSTIAGPSIIKGAGSIAICIKSMIAGYYRWLFSETLKANSKSDQSTRTSINEASIDNRVVELKTQDIAAPVLYQTENKTMGGFASLLIVLQCLGGIIFSFMNGYALFNAGGIASIFDLAYLILLIVLHDGFVFTFAVATLVFIAKESRKFILVFVFLQLAIVARSCLDFLVANSGADQNIVTARTAMERSILVAVVWIAYLALSKRVRNVFQGSLPRNAA